MTAARVARLFAAAALSVGLLVVPVAPQPAAVPTAEAASLTRWTGSVDLYRSGTFTTQKTFLWCTAANVQIARNIVRGQADHSRASQSSYFSWMRARNRYDIPVSDGVDPQGWAAGMRNFVDSRYRLVTSRSYTAALRSAVTSLRLTSRPVGVLVARGGHAWLLTGFSATADPAAIRDFTVTSVRVVGPLYGIQSRNGYDMPPNTSLSASAFKRFFTPWHYAGIRMAWEGLYGTVQATPANPAPVPKAANALHPPIPALTRQMPPAPSANAEAGGAAPEASADPAVEDAAAPAVVSAPPASASPAAPGPSTAGSGNTPVLPLLAATLILGVAIVLTVRSRRLPHGAPGRRGDRSRSRSDFA